MITQTRGRALAHVAVIIVIASFAAYYEAQDNPLWVTVPDNLVAVAFVLAGVVAQGRRRLDRSARLMLTVGYTWFLGNVGVVPALQRLGFWMGPWNKYWLVALLLTYPTGTTRRTIERVGLRITALALVIGNGLVAFTFDPHRYFGMQDYYPGPVLISNGRLFSFLANTLNWLFMALTLLLGYLLTQRWRRSSAAARRALVPLWVAGLLTTSAFLCTQSVRPFKVSALTSDITNAYSLYAQLLIPVAFLVGLVRVSRSRAAVADLVIALDDAPTPARLRDELARALGDPRLEIGFWAAERNAYLTGEGAAFTLPGAGARRASTLIGQQDVPLAALVHDPELLSQGALLRSVGAAARLSLENARLQAELRAQLNEVRASRGRIAAAALDERRRVERDLHDGAQQRLLALGITLSMAKDLVEQSHGSASSGLVDLIDEARAENFAAIDELRELARGVHPAVLSQQGLAAAVMTLADRSAVPLTLDVADKRCSPVVEATAYFVICEALTNMTKHAQATSGCIRVVVDAAGTLRVDVSDNGIGGAAVGHNGTGLRGLADRVMAVGGSLDVDSSLGAGTTVRAKLPCE